MYPYVIVIVLTDLLCIFDLQMSEGKVVATGPGRRSLQNGELIPVGVTEGQTVLLPEYGGTSVKLDNKE
jgi:chaperonin GroES